MIEVSYTVLEATPTSSFSKFQCAAGSRRFIDSGEMGKWIVERASYDEVLTIVSIREL